MLFYKHPIGFIIMVDIVRSTEGFTIMNFYFGNPKEYFGIPYFKEEKLRKKNNNWLMLLKLKRALI